MKKIQNLYLVDDDDIYVFLTRKIIEETQLTEHIEVFNNGQDVLDYLKNINDDAMLPEIILLDLFMPVMDGWEFLEEFAMLKPKLNRKITIYVTSSSISPHDMQRAKNISDVTDYVIKPINKERFVELIKNMAA